MRDPNPEGGPAARPAKEDQPAIAEQTAGVGSVTVRKTERGAARKLWLPLWHWQPAGRPWGYWAIHLSIAILGAAAPIYVTARLIGFLGVRPSDEVLNSIVGGRTRFRLSFLTFVIQLSTLVMEGCRCRQTYPWWASQMLWEFLNSVRQSRKADLEGLLDCA